MAKYLDSNGLSTLSALIKNAGLKIATGSYVGTGTVGVDNPNSLTFDFAPKLVLMLGRKRNNGTSVDQYFGYDNNNGDSGKVISVMCADLLTTEYNIGVGFFYRTPSPYGKKSADGKTFYWYNNYTINPSAEDQMNNSNYTYYYLAIG